MTLAEMLCGVVCAVLAWSTTAVLSVEDFICLMFVLVTYC